MPSPPLLIHNFLYRGTETMKLSHMLLVCACLVFAGVNFSTAVTPDPVPAP